MEKKSYFYHQADPALYPLLQEFAKKNRSNPTDAERVLWQYLKDKQHGHFRRQYIIGDYIADFICLSTNLIIELDGGYHQLPEQQMSDELRTQWLESRGFKVVRFSNEELLDSPESVMNKIKECQAIQGHE